MKITRRFPLLMLFIAIVSITFSSCEEEEYIVDIFEPPVSDRVILIEEMTGASCPNCPKGTAELENIKDLYGDLVIPVAVHGNFLAWPNDHSEYDFRFDESNDLEEYLGPHLGKPAALFNRGTYGEEGRKSTNSIDEWSSFVDAELEKPHVLNLDVLADYDEASRTISISVTLNPLANLGDNNRVSVMILENHIIDAQEDLSQIIDEFEFNHTLRAMVTNVSGNVITEDLEAGEFYNFTYQFQVPESEDLWVIDNLEVVAFCNNEDGGEFVVHQAGMAYLTE